MSKHENENVRNAIDALRVLSNAEFLAVLKAIGASNSLYVSYGDIVFNTGLDAEEMTMEAEESAEDDDSAYSEDVQEYLQDDEVRDSYKVFVRNICKAGMEENLRLRYRGRFFYDGPACDTSGYDVSDVVQAAKIPVQWDNLGFDYIVYPK